MAEITLEIATPDRLLLSSKVSEVEIPGKDGYLGVLPGHAPLISELGSGVLRYVAEGKSVHLAVSGGFAEILDDRVCILADSASRKEEIQTGKAGEDLLKAQELMNNPSDIDPAQALENVQKGQALLDTTTASG